MSRIEYPAMPIDLAPSLGQGPAIGRIDYGTAEPKAESPLRLLGDLVEPETAWKRLLFLAMALAITIGYFFMLASYWAPAPGRPGIDENGYLVGGKNFAAHGTTGFKPTDNYQFVGAMWVRTKDEWREPSIKLPWGLELPAFLKHKLTVHTKEGWYYPKYPLGTSMLDAIGIWIGSAEPAHGWGTPALVASIALTLLGIFFAFRSVQTERKGLAEVALVFLAFAAASRLTGAVIVPAHGHELAFLVSPVCATLAVLGIFLLTRLFTGSFYALLAMILLATGQTMLELSIDPNSHAPALCMVVWGMFFLLRWWQTGRWWRGVIAGLLLGYAVTIRYTEALLLFPLYPLDQVLSDTGLKGNHPHWWKLINTVRLLPIGPLGLAAILSIRWNRVRSYFLAAVPLAAWGVVVGGLVAFNWFAMGYVTGYDQTNESQGFSTAEFLKKWDFSVHELYLYGSFLIFPLGVLGIAMLFRRSVRAGFMLMLWFLPGALLYNAYYWGQQAPGVAFLRFFLTLFPPLIVAAMWLMQTATLGARPAADGAANRRRGSFAAPIIAGILTAATAWIGLWISLPDLERQHRGNMNLSISTHHISDKIYPPRTSARLAKTSTTMPAATQPVTPVIFADEGLFPQLLQTLQFMGEGDFYATDAFDLRIAGGFGLFGMGQKVENKQDAPVLLQRERIDLMTDFFKGKTAADLVKEHHRILNEAFGMGRPVYAVLTPIQLRDFKRRFMSDEYEMVELDHWPEPFGIHFPEEDRPGAPQASHPHATALAPRGWTGEPFIRWQPQELSLMQIQRKPPATQPTVAEQD